MWEKIRKSQIQKLRGPLEDFGHRAVNILDKWRLSGGLFAPFPWKAWSLNGPAEEGFLFVHDDYLVFPLGFQRAFPALPRSAKDHLERREIPITLVGFETQVLSLMEGLRRSPYDRILYDYFLGPEVHSLGAEPELPADLRITGLGLGDAERYFPLRAQYEQEEVTIQGHSWNRQFSWKRWRRTLQVYEFLGIESSSGEPIGMAGVNGLAPGYAQLGGVYVKMHRRQQGIGRLAIQGLLSHLAKKNLRSCLYVKKSNLAAQNLYLALDFHKVGDYTIAYL
jgi:ribosomal protein S18 acetylase RimI-like enzyme